MAVQEAAHKYNKFEKIEMLAPEVQAVLLGARIEAGDKGYATTHTVHFLAALLQSDEFEIAEILREGGLTVKGVQKHYKRLKKKLSPIPQQWRPAFSVQVEQAIRLVDENDSAEEQMCSLLRTMTEGGKDSSVLLNQAVFAQLRSETERVNDVAIEAQAA